MWKSKKYIFDDRILKSVDNFCKMRKIKKYVLFERIIIWKIFGLLLHDKSFIKRYNIVSAGGKVNHITKKGWEKLIEIRERMRDTFDIYESNWKNISNMKKKIKIKEYSETNNDCNKSKTPILISKNKVTMNNLEWILTIFITI